MRAVPSRHARSAVRAGEQAKQSRMPRGAAAPEGIGPEPAGSTDDAEDEAKVSRHHHVRASGTFAHPCGWSPLDLQLAIDSAMSEAADLGCYFDANLVREHMDAYASPTSSQADVCGMIVTTSDAHRTIFKPNVCCDVAETTFMCSSKQQLRRTLRSAQWDLCKIDSSYQGEWYRVMRQMRIPPDRASLAMIVSEPPYVTWMVTDGCTPVALAVKPATEVTRPLGHAARPAHHAHEWHAQHGHAQHGHAARPAHHAHEGHA